MAQPFEFLRQGNPGGRSPITTGAIGPNSVFQQGEFIYVPGIGMVNAEDYGPGPGRRGLDIASRSVAASRSPAVNRMVTINGQRIRLTGYPPAQYDPGNRDPTGGGNYVRGTNREIIPWSGQPPGGWEEPLANEPGFQTGPGGGQEEFEPGPQITSGGQEGLLANEPGFQVGPAGGPEEFEPGPTQPSATPTELPSPGGIEMANQFQEPTQFQAPAVPEPTGGGDFGGGGFPGPTPSELPSPSEIPMFEPQVSFPAEEPPPPGANIPTFETPAATGPQEQFLPSTGENIPTNDQGIMPAETSEFLPATPEYQYDEEFQAAVPEADWVAPDQGVGAAVEEPPQTFSYPTGDGTYTTLDASGNPVTEPGMENVGGVTFNAEGTGPSDVGNGPLYYDPVTKSWVARAAGAVAGVPGAIGRGIRGIPGSIANAARGIGTGIKNAIETPGWSSPEYLREQGYREGAGRESLWPGSAPTVGARDIGAFGAGGEGGSFFHANPHQQQRGVNFSPLAGTPGIFGRGASAASEQVPFWQRMLMRQAQATARRGYRSPLIGTGDAVAQFAARLGSHPRFQGAYSPAARRAAIAAGAGAGAGGGTQQAPPPSGEGRGARGPGGRSMSPV